MYSPEGPQETVTTTSFAPPVDVYEDEHNIILKIEVPGIDEKDIDVRMESNTLTTLERPTRGVPSRLAQTPAATS